jgi:hypothetical protein
MIERLIRRWLIHKVRKWNDEPLWNPLEHPEPQVDTSILRMFDSLLVAAETADKRIPFRGLTGPGRP